MYRWWRTRAVGRLSATASTGSSHRLVADGGEDVDEEDVDDGETADDQADEGADVESDDSEGADDSDGSEASEGSDESADPDEPPGIDRSNVEVTASGTAEPADPKWEKPDIDDIPEFETGATEPLTKLSADDREDPTAGMPNTARSPDNSRINREGTEGYVAALELCARLPEDVRLPDQAADLVPAAVEAELEQDVQSFAAAEFDNPSPHVDVLEFVERGDEIWLRLRLGIPAGSFAELDPEEIRSHALQTLDGLF